MYRIPIVVLAGQSQQIVRQCRAECATRGWLLEAVPDTDLLLDKIASVKPAAVILSPAETMEANRELCRLIRTVQPDDYTPIIAFPTPEGGSRWGSAATLGFDAWIPSEAGVTRLCDEVMTLMEWAYEISSRGRGRTAHFQGFRRRRSDRHGTDRD